jgi:hypothetical protein
MKQPPALVEVRIMSLSGLVLGFADFRLSLPLVDAAALLSNEVFGGIPFVEKPDDESDDVATLVLKADFCGITAELIGSEGSYYTIELDTRPSASVAEVSEVCDLSAMLKQRLSHLPGVTILPPCY